MCVRVCVGGGGVGWVGDRRGASALLSCCCDERSFFALGGKRATVRATGVDVGETEGQARMEWSESGCVSVRVSA